MDMKNNKGITLIALIITIIILTILLAVAIPTGIDIANKAKFENVETSLLLVQSKCKTRYDKQVIGEIEEEELYGIKQEDGDYTDWYLLSQADLDNMGLKKLKEEEKYYVNYEQNDVAYGIGIEYEGQVYYKLSEMKSR